MAYELFVEWDLSYFIICYESIYTQHQPPNLLDLDHGLGDLFFHYVIIEVHDPLSHSSNVKPTRVWLLHAYTKDFLLDLGIQNMQDNILLLEIFTNS